jgi:hypothetical protein
LHPSADERCKLATKEKLEIPVLQCAKPRGRDGDGFLPSLDADEAE